MHSIRDKYNRHGVTKCRTLLLLLFSFCVIAASGQKLNNPNKRGPLGTQVNTMSGNLFIPRTDIYIPARGFDLDISFHYNSFLYTEEYGYGRGWTFKYNIRYSHDTIPGARLIMWGDGREDRYDSLGGGAYRSPKGFFNTLSQYQPGKYVLAELNGIKYFFDNSIHKGITRMEEPNGNYINFSYTDTLLTGITNAAGQAITFTYNPQGRLAMVTDAVATPSRSYTYTYDVTGNLKEVKDPLNGKCQYTYLVNGPMKSLADKNNNKIDIIYYSDMTIRELVGCNKRLSFSYDTASHITLVTDYLDAGNQVTKYTYKKVDDRAWVTSVSGNCCGFNLAYEYDDQGNLAKMTDANGQIYTYTYDGYGNVLSITDPLGQVSTYTYTTDFKKMNSFRDPKGNLYTLGYDAKGNLTQLVTPGNNIYTASYNSSGDIIGSTDPKGNIYNYSYDNRGNPAVVTGPGGYSATLSFDPRGNLLAYTDAMGNNSTVEYDILSRLKKITDPVNNNMQFTYDAQDNPVSFVNKNNETTILNYDASNRLVKITGPTGNQATLTYDGMDNLLSATNALGHELKMSYDNRNRLKEVKDPENNNQVYDYDGNGNITSTSFPNGRSVNYAYDQLNRLISVSDNTGTIATMAYDKNGSVTKYTNATGAITTAGYDSLGRIKQVTDPLGNSVTYAYDKNNNVISVTDREGHTSHYTYDSLDRVKTYTDKNGFVITVGYDAEDNIISLKDQNNNTTTYTYDALNRRKRMVYPGGKYRENTYDSKSNVTAIRLTDGTIIAYQYDTLNRVITKTLPGGEVYSFTYDKLNRVLTATNNSGTVTFTYDALNRIISESFDGRTVSYNYNNSGRTQTIIYPGGTTVAKEYDTRNRLVKILKDGEMVVEYTYSNFNQLTGRNFANGVNSILQYDFANRLSSITTANGTIQSTVFSYDKENNKTAVTRLNNPSLSEQFTYDNGYRLTNYKRGPAGSPVIQNTYTYDAVGNRTAANLDGVAVNYTINNLNQLTAVNGTNFTFDDRGNITYDGTFYKTYDAENRLVKDSSSPAAVITYGYDAFNRRVTRSVNGNTLKYTYSGITQVEERNSSNTLLNSTVFKNFISPVMNEKNGSNYYYHSNELGSVEALTNSNGRLIESYRYDAYGKLSRFDSLGNPLASSIAGNRFGFTGQEYDSASGGYRFFFRNYSPATGVFNQRDPIEYQDGMGMYQYAGNNPANGVDILGLDCGGGSFFSDLSFNLSGLGNFNKLRSSIQIRRNHNYYEGRINNLKSDAATHLRRSERVSEGAPVSKRFHAEHAAESELGIAENMVKRDKIKAGMIESSENFGDKLDRADKYIKGGIFAYEMLNGKSNEQYTEEARTGGDFLLTLFSNTGPGKIYAAADFGVEFVTGDGITTHTAHLGGHLGEISTANGLEIDNDAWAYASTLEGKDGGNRGKDWMMAAQKMEERIWRNHCKEYGGSLRILYRLFDGQEEEMDVDKSQDPNEIIGPEGKPNKKWVSVKERLPYTILFENDSSATARAHYIKITSPVEPNQDPTTLELGSVGFNNQSFEIPQGQSFYYQRLDARDSTGVYVDITAGYDVVNHQLFWELQAIDPLTLLPPEDPLDGFLFLRDSLQPEYGNGFVNFSIKPRADAQTLDTIGARAFIVFDENEIIPTNIHTNTIDAVEPTSQLNGLSVVNNTFTLTWTGADDPGGSGIDHYTIYVSTDQVNYNVLFPRVTGLDTTFILPPDSSYCFFVLATDRVGHMETFRQGSLQCASFVGALPVTWLYFNGTNQGKDNLLKWGTANEQNSKEFRLERSLNGTNFTVIAIVPAAGNSPVNQYYSYTDTRVDLLNSKTMFYRLKQVDRDDKFKYSSIVRLHYNQNNTSPTIVYPNPTGGMVTVVLGDMSLLGTEAIVVDINGRVLQRVKLIAGSQEFNLQSYVSGIYLIRLSNKETLKVIKQ